MIYKFYPTKMTDHSSRQNIITIMMKQLSSSKTQKTLTFFDNRRYIFRPEISRLSMVNLNLFPEQARLF